MRFIYLEDNFDQNPLANPSKNEKELKTGVSLYFIVSLYFL